MKQVTVGLLPLYIALYDQVDPGLRVRLEQFYEKIAGMLEAEGLTVVRVPFCRLDGEFRTAVRVFEEAGAQVIVTLHMAYSPSLEAAPALLGTKLPIVVLDTTETYAFDKTQDPAEINYCHGIHGVMDLCSLLLRGGKPYAVAAGHYRASPVVARAAGLVRAACAAGSLSGVRVGRFGGEFHGMGDFAVTAEELKTVFGVTQVEAEPEELRRLGAGITREELAAERAADGAAFDGLEAVEPELYRESAKAGLTIRKWLEAERLDAFTVNFLGINPEAGLNSMPFLEACKAMARGVGYAGEGDTLTAAFCGALVGYLPDTSFVEIFCPDWKGNALLISHMGEMNYRLADGKPVLRAAGTNYTPSALPVAGYARFRPGSAVYLNVCRDRDGFKLAAAPVEMLDARGDSFEGCIRGWLRPREKDIGAFLESISQHGATHHSLLVYGGRMEQVEFFGRLLGLRTERL